MFLSATADSQHEIVSMGEDGMRRYAKPDFEDETVKNIPNILQFFAETRIITILF